MLKPIAWVLPVLLAQAGWAGVEPASPVGVSAQQDVSRSERLDALFTRLTEEDGFQGGALLAREGEVLWEAAHGLANTQTGEPLTHESVYELASVGKAFTAMAVLTLVDAGAMSLDDAADEHLDGFPYPGISVRQLLNHTAGLPDYTGFMSEDELPNGFDAFLQNEDVLGWLAGGTDGLLFEPGEHFSYSNTNYLMLALIVEAVSDKPFGVYLQETIFDPLGMAQTRSFTTRYSEGAVPPGYAFGYARSKITGRLTLPEDQPGNAFLAPFSTVEGDGTVAGSLRDFARWEQAWTTDILIPEALRQAAFTPTPLGSGGESGYGLAWEIDPDSGLVHHGGGWPGYSTGVYIDRETRTVFVFASTAPIRSWGWLDEAIAAAFEEPLGSPTD